MGAGGEHFLRFLFLFILVLQTFFLFLFFLTLALNSFRCFFFLFLISGFLFLKLCGKFEDLPEK